MLTVVCLADNCLIGPLLRLEKPGHRLTKAQRYGQPYDRPIYSSSVPPRKMQAIVQSYLGFGLQGLKPEDGGWNWQDLQDINQQIHWQVRQIVYLHIPCSVLCARLLARQ